MAGILNKTARQFNLKCITKQGHRVIVRVAPGFNVVTDEHWEAFVPKSGKGVDPYVAELKKLGHLDYGDHVNDLELEMDPDTVSKSRSEPMAVLTAQLEKASKDAEDNLNIANKHKAEAEKAQAEAETAKLALEKAQMELAQLKAANKPVATDKK